MGYSSRYHVASLAAVFLALGVGILIGTGLKSVVSDTTRDLASSIRSNLKDQLADSRGQVAGLNRELDDERSFDEEAYPGLVGGILQNARVAVVSLGGLDPALEGDISQVIGPGNVTGARLQSDLVVNEPPNLRGLASAIEGRSLGGGRVRGLARGGDALSSFATHAGVALARGGGLFRRIHSTLLGEQSGAPVDIDAVIVTRQTKTDLAPDQQDFVDRLEAGILDGLHRTGLPVVGVERTSFQHSSVTLFRDHGLTSVDDLDLYAGRVALAYALLGTEGTFGVKSTADRLMPALHGPGLGVPAGRAQVHR